MNTKSFPPWKTAVCLAWAVLISLGLSASSPAVPERPVDDTAPLEDQEIPVTEKNTYPYVDIHGDYRWLWARGQFRADSRTAPDKVRRHDERIYLTTRRLRLFPFIHLNEKTSLRTQLEDLRNDKDANADHHLYLGRLYVQHEQARLKVEAGRFNYYLLDGNVIDKKVDGLRLRLGERTTGPGSLTFFAGRTTGSDDRHRLRGWSLLYSSQHGRLKSDAAYLDFRRLQDLPSSRPSLIGQSRAGTGFDEQRIAEWRLMYELTPKLTASLDLLHAWGRHDADDYDTTDSGFVAALTYGHLDERQKGSYEAWIRYYDQPSASILYHTMDGDTTFFRRMDFRGWGARLDYIVCPGLDWAIEGFSLKNRHDTVWTGDFRETVIGTSLTAYF